MTRDGFVTSRRLRAAACAEARRLIKRRDRVAARIGPLQAEIDRIDEQIALIEKAAGLVVDRAEGTVDRTPPGPTSGVPLTGKAIRVQAVRSVIDRYPLGTALHARSWYAVFREDGYAVAAADPFASFLTQLSRSPWVVSSSRRGVYALAAESPLWSLRDAIARVYGQAQDATDADEKMGLLRDARRLMKLRDEAEESVPVRGVAGVLVGTQEMS